MQGLLISPGWEYVHEDPAEQLRQLRAIPVRKLVPHGFVFCWAQKWNAQALVKWLTGQDYRLVENLTWVRLYSLHCLYCLLCRVTMVAGFHSLPWLLLRVMLVII